MRSREIAFRIMTFVATIVACHGRCGAQRTSMKSTIPGAPQQTKRLPADREIVRSAGVPTDSDDTANTRYGKHVTPRRVATPDCRPVGIALCLSDIAESRFSVDCCVPDQRQTHWLVFAARDDSLQLFLDRGLSAFITMSPPNAAGAIGETSGGVDASWIRARVASSGSYVFTASMDAEGTAPYQLRVASVIATGASQPIGTAATLNLVGEQKSRIAVAPHAMFPSNDPQALRRFAVAPGRYRVLLVRDSLYEACRLPCRRPKAFTLRAGESVAVAP